MGGGGSKEDKEEAKVEITRLIKENAVIVFSKTTCGFCARVKGLLKDLKIQFKVVELNTGGIATGAWQGYLRELTGASR